MRIDHIISFNAEQESIPFLFVSRKRPWVFVPSDGAFYTLSVNHRSILLFTRFRKRPGMTWRTGGEKMVRFCSTDVLVENDSFFIFQGKKQRCCGHRLLGKCHLFSSYVYIFSPLLSRRVGGQRENQSFRRLFVLQACLPRFTWWSHFRPPDE